MSDIVIHVTSGLTNSERRVSPQWTLSHFNQRLETITGIPPTDQQLLLFPTNFSTESITINQSNLNVSLESLQIKQGSRIHVNDTRPISELSELNDESNTEFFELNDDEYDKKSGTVRQWKKDNKLGRFDPTIDKRKQDQIQNNVEKSKNFKIGNRFRTIDDINGERRGLIKYIGKVSVIDDENIWIGVEFDEPVGKNDGSLKGERYFKTQTNRGGFLKPLQVEQGDFPEELLFSDDEI